MSDTANPELLPEVEVDPEGSDHPDEVTEIEAERGHEVYLAVDDLDDESTGVDP